jgi:small-conductance mechanosensitive channel
MVNNIFAFFGDARFITMGEFSVTITQAIILLAGIIAISVMNWLVVRFIKRHRLFHNFSDKLRKLIARAASYIVWIVGLIILLRAENVNTKDFFNYEIYSGDVVTFTVQKLFGLFVIFFVIRIVVLVVDFFMNRKIIRDNLDYGKGKSVLQITKYFIWIIGILIAIGSIGLKLTFFIASISALLVGVGFGLQNIFNDFFSGIIILFDGSIKVNDVVQVGDVVGRV